MLNFSQVAMNNFIVSLLTNFLLSVENMDLGCATWILEFFLKVWGLTILDIMHNMAKANLYKTENEQDQSYHSMKAYNFGDQNLHRQKSLMA